MNTALLAACCLLGLPGVTPDRLIGFSHQTKTLYECDLSTGAVRKTHVNGDLAGVEALTDVMRGPRFGQVFVTTMDQGKSSSLLAISAPSKGGRVVRRQKMPFVTSFVLPNKAKDHLFALSWNGLVARYAVSKVGEVSTQFVKTSGSGDADPGVSCWAKLDDQTLVVGNSIAFAGDGTGWVRIYRNLSQSDHLTVFQRVSIPDCVSSLAVRPGRRETWVLTSNSGLFNYREGLDGRLELSRHHKSLSGSDLAFSASGHHLYLLVGSSVIRTYRVKPSGSLVLLKTASVGATKGVGVSRLAVRGNRLIGFVEDDTSSTLINWPIGKEGKLGRPIRSTIRAKYLTWER